MRSLLRQARSWLPQGRGLSNELWRRRHRGMVRLLWAHVVALGLVALATGGGVLHALGEVVVMAVPAILASRPELSRRARRPRARWVSSSPRRSPCTSPAA